MVIYSTIEKLSSSASSLFSALLERLGCLGLSRLGGSDVDVIAQKIQRHLGMLFESQLRNAVPTKLWILA